MPVELRKRKTPPPAAAPPTKKKSTDSKLSKVKAAAKDLVKPTSSEKTAEAAPAQTIAVGSTIDLATFGGELETHDGQKTTLAKLVEESKAGVVIFTYPKANTPGCTQQACLFRDAYAPLTATGLKIYGLSTDSTTSNTSFVTKKNLQYPLLCDPTGAALLKPIGFHKAPKSAKRGVFVVDKNGKVLANEAGGPQATVDVVKKVVDTMPKVENGAAPAAEKTAAEEKEKVAESAPPAVAQAEA